MSLDRLADSPGAIFLCLLIYKPMSLTACCRLALGWTVSTCVNMVGRPFTELSHTLFCGHSADVCSFSPPPAAHCSFSTTACWLHVCPKSGPPTQTPVIPSPLDPVLVTVHRELSLGWGGDLSVEAGYFCLSAGKPEASVTFPAPA